MTKIASFHQRVLSKLDTFESLSEKHTLVCLKYKIRSLHQLISNVQFR